MKNNLKEYKNLQKYAEEAGNGREHTRKVMGKYQERAGKVSGYGEHPVNPL